MPDLTVSYSNKDLTISAETIRDDNRTDETVVYIAQILVNSNLSYEDRVAVLESTVTLFDTSKREPALKHLESLNNFLEK